MQTAVRILANTPVWVFVLLAYLVWQGAQAHSAKDAAYLAGADRAPGVFSDGYVAARDR
jgi:hypothetical protein